MLLRVSRAPLKRAYHCIPLVCNPTIVSTTYPPSYSPHRTLVVVDSAQLIRIPLLTLPTCQSYDSSLIPHQKAQP
ncbi:hypothetical protein Hanom_Chr00s025366g01764381 [Helianthus anomalus]